MDSELDGPRCEWLHSGGGIEYQVLAGPIFVVIFTFAGILIGFLGDRVSRTRLVSACVVIYSLTGMLTAFATEYWHLVLLRMIFAAG